MCFWSKLLFIFLGSKFGKLKLEPKVQLLLLRPISPIASLSQFLTPKTYWRIFQIFNHDSHQCLASNIGEPTSSFCCERNWSSCSFLHSFRKSKLTSKCAKGLIFIHNNLRLLQGIPLNIMMTKKNCGMLEEMNLQA